MAIRFLTIFGTLCLHSVVSSSVSYISKCNSADDKCIKESSQTALPILAVGLPDMGIDPLDPLFMKKVDASSNNLKLLLTDVTVTGLKNCEVKKMQRDKAKSKLYINLLCDVQLEGTYDMKGRLLILPIEGQGPVHATVRKILIIVETDLTEKLGKDGVNHWQIKRFTHSFELKAKSDVAFENLFSGNAVLAQAANSLISNSGNDIINEVGAPIIKDIVTIVVTTCNKFFAKVPVSDLSID